MSGSGSDIVIGRICVEKPPTSRTAFIEKDTGRNQRQDGDDRLAMMSLCEGGCEELW
jgi:hypothetical protein